MGLSDTKKVLATITIGQSPRIDLTPDIVPLLGDNVELREYGALDDMTYEQVQAAFEGEWAPRPDDETLVSRMRDGRQAHFTERFVTPLVQAKIDQAEAEGADMTILLCTGAFPKFRHTGLFVEPQPLLHAVVRTIAAGQRVGVLVPMPDQVEQAYKFWGAHRVDVIVAHASPYLLSPQEIGAAARDAFIGQGLVGGQGPALICTDCMGFTVKMKRAITAACSLPVVLPRTLIARAAAELLG